MKNIKYIVMIVVAMVFTSCDDYLDIKPKGKIILKNVDEYNGLFNDVNFLHGSYFMDFSTVTDEWWPGNDQFIINNTQPFVTANFLWDESIDRVENRLTDFFYNKAYQRISRYNIIMQEVLDAVGNDADKKEVFAKAQILRAFNHFMLINIYAKHYNKSTAATDRGILLVKEFNMEQTLVQSTVQEAYDFILEDIEAAIPNLKSVTESPVHPSKAFGYALLAKVYLFMKNFPAALKAANNSLKYNDFIFDMVKWHNQGTPGTYIHKNAEVKFDTPENVFYGGGQWGFPASRGIMGPLTLSKFGKGDIRLDDFYIKPFWIPGAIFRVWFNYRYKYNSAGMKTTEVWLMKAECLARDGDVAGAMAIVNTLRAKRIMPVNYKKLTASTPKEAVEIIIDERARELFGTSNRFWDMRRFNTEPEFAKTYKKVFNGHTYTVKPGSPIFIMPFAKSATDRNKSLQQNTN